MALNIALKQDKINQICCSLSTFVKIVCTIFLVIYFGIGISGVFWYLAEKFGFLNFNLSDSSAIVNVAEKEDGEINGFEEFELENDLNEGEKLDDSFKKIVIFSIVLVFALTGVMVNLLVLLSMRSNKRTLILPWLVYHTGVIIGKIYTLGFCKFTILNYYSSKSLSICLFLKSLYPNYRLLRRRCLSSYLFCNNKTSRFTRSNRRSNK